MPGFVLDMRSAPVGGAVVPARLTLPTPTLDDLQRAPHIAFLVHGFNVNRSDGAAELTAFGQRLAALGAGAAVAVLWPGDSVVGPLSYPFETNNADDSALELAKFIADSLTQGPRLSFVGHSLGCRVVMQTVRHLWIKNIPVAQVCLMAAAIDNDCLASIAEYQGAAQAAARVGVLWSPCDSVLQHAYPLGNLMSAFLHGSSTTDAALGYTGPVLCTSPPGAIPSEVAPVGIPRPNAVGHGDYLPSASGAWNSSQQSAARFADAMLAGTVPLIYG